MAAVPHTLLERFLLLRALQPLDTQPFTPSFEEASAWLKNSELLRDASVPSKQRLDPESLKDLFLTLLKDQASLEASTRNGSPTKPTNQRKRKLPSASLQSLDDASHFAYLLPKLAARLFEEYKTEIVSTIQNEEKLFVKLKQSSNQGSATIDKLSQEGFATKSKIHRAQGKFNQVAEVDLDGATVVPSAGNDGNDGNEKLQSLNPPNPHIGAISVHSSSPSGKLPKPQVKTSQASDSTPQPPSPLAHGSLGAGNVPNGAMSGVQTTQGHTYHAGYVAPFPAQSFSTGTPPTPHTSAQPPPQYYYDNRGYPITYQPYMQGPVQLYHSPGVPMPSYQSARASPFPSNTYPTSKKPQPAGYYQYQYQSQTPYPPPVHATPVAKTPMSKAHHTNKPTPIVTSSSSTKWKDAEKTSLPLSSKSPARPTSREISPISDASSSDDDGNISAAASATNGHALGTKQEMGNINGGSNKKLQQLTVDNSSPIDEDDLITEDVEAERCSHGRDNTSDPESTRSSMKVRRKVDNPEHQEGTDEHNVYDELSHGSGTTASKRPKNTRRKGFLLATRNFSRVALPLLNGIAAHRLASLFAKPLTDKNAPGYRDLIYRPQDLKSLRAAVNAGSRATLAIIEQLDQDSTTDSSAGSAHVWLPETEELVPPRGIVNADQLEKELMRIFANAIMFNPDVSHHRGFGPNFRLRHHRRKFIETDQPGNLSEDDGGSDSESSGLQEGAVVTDAREVAKDVQEAFTAWRAAERNGVEPDDMPVLGSTPVKMRPGVDDDTYSGMGNEVRDSVEDQDGDEGERRSKRRRK